MCSTPPKTNSEPWGAWQGTFLSNQIMFSACHEAAHIRDGIDKIAESGTAELCFSLASSISASAISTVEPQIGDPNWDYQHPYVQLIEDQLTGSNPICIELHMMQPRGIDVCVGLGVNPKLVEGLWQPLIDFLVREGLKCSVNWPFSAEKRTVTSKLQERGIPALQIELSWECFEVDNQTALAAQNALFTYANFLQLKLGM